MLADVADQPSGKRLPAILWFVAAGLAFVAFAISVARNRDPEWTVAAAALFCVAMGVTAWSRVRPSPPSR
jgi:4-amino-4-deoxy-L-arabinose transferase-like glycosyltransferase